MARKLRESKSAQLPVWFRQEIPSYAAQKNIRLLADLKVHTVCQEARCPNLSRCFKNNEVTFIILGDICTRGCKFCAVKKSGRENLAVDCNEPEQVAQAVRKLGLTYVVVTSVTRDDLSDGGAGQFSRVIELIREINFDIGIEVLVPDFSGDPLNIKMVAVAFPEVLAHNLETVSRLSPELRPQADYRRSLNLLRLVKESSSRIVTKSSIMLGLGETSKEVAEAMRDLRSVNCDILVLGQYLAPSEGSYPVKEFVTPEKFSEYSDIALSLGFKAVSSMPLARSSYKAGDLYRRAVNV